MNSWQLSAPQIRVLFECEPERGPPPLEPGERASHRRVLQRKTLMFNGYAEQARGSGYAGMDLKKNY